MLQARSGLAVKLSHDPKLVPAGEAETMMSRYAALLRNVTRMGMPFLGSRNILADGCGSKSGSTSKCAARTKVAVMIVASIIANAAPMQILGPTPNGMN